MEVCRNKRKLILNQYAEFFLWILRRVKQSHILPERSCLSPGFHFLCNAHSCVMMNPGFSSVNSTSYTPRGIISIYLGLGYQNDKLNRVIPNDKTVQKANLIPLLLWSFARMKWFSLTRRWQHSERNKYNRPARSGIKLVGQEGIKCVRIFPRTLVKWNSITVTCKILDYKKRNFNKNSRWFFGGK